MSQNQAAINNDNTRAKNGPPLIHDQTISNIVEQRRRTIASAHYVFSSNPQSQALLLQKRQTTEWNERYDSISSANIANRASGQQFETAFRREDTTQDSNASAMRLQEIEDLAHEALSEFQKETNNV